MEDRAGSGRGRFETFFGFKVPDHDGFPFFFSDPDETPGSGDETLDFRDGDAAVLRARTPVAFSTIQLIESALGGQIALTS
jgi:hypothetical protein